MLGGIAKGLENVDIITKTILVAIAGGTASVIGGGKFANGAMSAAFIFMFNEMVTETRKVITSIKSIKYRYKSGALIPEMGRGTAFWHKTYDETSYWESRNTYIDGEATNTEWEAISEPKTHTVTEVVTTSIQGVDLSGGYSSDDSYAYAIIYHPDGHTFLAPVRSH